MSEKYILDVCCGSRAWWKQKKNPNTIYMDIRKEPKGFIEGEKYKHVEVNPDIIGDYTNIPFSSKSFSLVVFDPPHLIKNTSGIISKRYGYLGDNWELQISKGFDECMRVLKDKGILIMKWADTNISPRKILPLLSQEMLIGTHTKKGVNNTYFWTFMKVEK